MTVYGRGNFERESPIPDGFLFTQHSLSTFDSCPLKFKKRYIENLKWSSYPDANVKKRLDLGNDFHLFAHRYFLGIEEDYADDESLKRWITNLKNSFPIEQDVAYFPEYKIRMSGPLMRLEANFDLILIKNNKLQIWDWKTHVSKTHNDNKKSRYEESLQTIVYMFVLKEQLSLLTKAEIVSGDITMNYWQPEPPGVIESISYSDEKHKLYGEAIEKKISTILGYDYSSFDKQGYLKSCKYCEFNWYCNNEKVDYSEIEEDEDFLDSLSWD